MKSDIAGNYQILFHFKNKFSAIGSFFMVGFYGFMV